MLSRSQLKDHLHNQHNQLVKLLIILAANEIPTRVSEIRQLALDAGLRDAKTWNISRTLGRSKGLAILVNGSWELTARGQAYAARALGIQDTPEPGPPTIATDLRAEMANLTDPVTRKFVEEAVICYEAGALRSAVVMSWQAAVDHVYNQVLKTKLAEFNTLAASLDKKWEPAIDRDGLAVMKEFTFLERACTVKVIDKNLKHALEECLKRRNAAGHPNSFKVGPRQVAAHIETLIQNVFQKYAPPPPPA